jgi:hypothetical protein
MIASQLRPNKYDIAAARLGLIARSSPRRSARAHADRMRGHGSLLGAMDTTAFVRKGVGVRTATVVKANDSDEGESVAEKPALADRDPAALCSRNVRGAATSSLAQNQLSCDECTASRAAFRQRAEWQSWRTATHCR